MILSKEVEELLNETAKYAGQKKHEYVTPEHMIYILAQKERFAYSFLACGGDCKKLKQQLEQYLEENLECVKGDFTEIQISYSLNQMLNTAAVQTQASGKQEIEIIHIVHALYELKDSYALYYILSQGVEEAALLYELNKAQLEKEESWSEENWEENREEKIQEKLGGALKRYAVCINEEVKKVNPLIGRELELERTIQILCRKDKNNPLHIGEPGVGKTAIIYGLANLIEQGMVPDKLKQAKIYGVDLGGLLAGTQFRGDFEKRFKQLMEELKKENTPILYIDEIHNIVGAGAVNGSSFDASNLLKPYLSSGEIRFIGATTYEEYKKYFSKSKSLVRRFQTIDIKEPSIEETIKILNGLKPYYEEFHQVKYQEGVIDHAVTLSAKYMNEKYLPDKAIDLMDEAGAYRILHKEKKQVQTVDKKLIEEVISKICNIPKQTVETEEVKKLGQLEKRLNETVFGQEEAVSQLANAVKFSKAGLREENKPVSSLLFVGPTGVGKTEMAKALSEILGISLIRFDMSEYAEKHTVAKLIGSPAGYVGYEEGGLLTESVRKHPHCILLLDEMEKAHPDIFNVLLQVMDYATLTDNQGRKADFRNVILLMTSNAGATKAGKAAIGFGGMELNEGAITDEVKKVFSPEFRNRLDRIILFHPINENMAAQIVEKQLKQLARQLKEKKVTLKLSKACKEYLKTKGLSREYGAREIQRIINTELKPLLVDEILFGRLKKGGNCVLDFENENIYIKFVI